MYIPVLSNVWSLLLLILLIQPVLSYSFPTPAAYAKQAAAPQLLPLRSRSHEYAPSLYPDRRTQPLLVLRKRAQRVIVPGVTMQTLRVTAYIGASRVLEDFYRAILNAALSHPRDTTIGSMAFTYGSIVGCFDSALPISWGLIHDFALTMLIRVHAGEQNFYIANIMTDAPFGLGQQVIRLIMGTPVTQLDIANEAWAATVGEWFHQSGLS